MDTPQLVEGNYCYYVLQDQKDEFRPCLVIEGEPGYRMLPWVWGFTYEEARDAADRQNEDIGISRERRNQIVASSMAAQNLGKRRAMNDS